MSGAARLGDMASGHGCFPPTPITSASSGVFINGIPAARQSDTAATHGCPCPNTPHGSHPRSISGGSQGVFIDGLPAARVGDAMDCGGTIISGSSDVIIGPRELVFFDNNNLQHNGEIRRQIRTNKKIQKQTHVNFTNGIYKMSQFNTPINKFTKQDIQIISKETLFQGFFRIVKYRFKHKLFQGGWSKVIERELFERGHATALLPYDPQKDQVVIIEQIRVGALEQHHPWQLEIIAGMIDRNESAIEVACREAVEEAGVVIGRTEAITSYYPSAGGCSEKLDVYVGEVDSSQATGIHGLDYEGEDIKVHVISRQQAYQLVKDGIIENGASIIALQWLELNYQNLQSKWSSISE